MESVYDSSMNLQQNLLESSSSRQVAHIIVAKVLEHGHI